MKHPIHVYSEIGELKTVLLKRPGRELENLTPEYLERLLFDDIPHLPVIQKEHDYFASALQNRGVEVLYLEKLMAETLSLPGVREKFVADILSESKSNINGSYETLKEYLLGYDNETLIETVMAGIRKSEIKPEKRRHLHEMIEDTYPFFLDPMPNLYFTRDPAAAIGQGLSINRMKEPARRRESLFTQYIMRYHPRFAKHDVPIWSDRDYRFAMEGGDELVLSKEVVAIGISERTTAQGIERVALNLLKHGDSFKKVIAIEIPKSRAFMHLDTVFTMVDHDKFTIHPFIQGPEGKMNIFELSLNAEGELQITQHTDLLKVLKDVLGLQEATLIPCGGGDPIAAAREQWNDGSNTLAIAPGVVVTYDRNYVSNELLRKEGVEVIEIMSSELSRGRGGPRCMSCPIIRQDI
ncbi:arginine deiminase [Exiguobacterium aestuarii]|uniref:Arginine deiminase n=1 Tax=Exiguobacterium aestuarii TaxID=273527 RepID=A0ABW2PGJ8_9BACL|nr:MULTISPECIES: arginine deiminase [Exiguobacterium]MCT4784913.1 arginine deiminase [Exiguobacterium aestuarii]